MDGDGGNPQLQAVQMGSEDNSTVHFDLGALFQEFFFVPHTFEQSAKGTVHLCQSAVNFLSMLAPGAMAHPGKSKVFLPVM